MAAVLVFLVLAFLAVNAEPSEDLVLKFLSGNAKCLDGTQATYYINRNPLSDVWVVYFQGGAYCSSPAECSSRLSTPLGTSSVLPPTTRGIDQIVEIYNGDPVANPDFAYANRIYVPYCSGDGLLGRRTFPMTPAGWPFYFAGHYIITGVFEDLKNNYGFGTKAAGVEHLVLGGRSAGGIGVMQHIDLIASTYPTVNVKGYLNAAFFLDIADYPQWTAAPVMAPTPGRSALNSQLAPLGMLFDAYIDPQCLAAQTAASQPPLSCIYGPVVMPHISTPLFLANAFFDSFQIANLHATPAVFDTNTMTYAGYFGTIMRAYLQSVLANPATGLFGVSCFTHGINFTTTLVNGQTLQQTFGNWYFNNGLPSRSIDGPVTAAGFSNPTCNALVFGQQGPPNTFTRHGCVGKSARLTPTDYYVVSAGAYAPIDGLTNPGIFTVSMWVKLNTLDSNRRALVSKFGSDGSGGDAGWSVSVSDEGINFHLDLAGGLTIDVDSGSSVELNQWTFIVASFDGSEVARLTVDETTSEQSAEFAADGFPSASSFSRLMVGRRTMAFENNDWIQDVLMAELGIWNRVLSEQEIASIRDGRARDVSVAARVALSYPITAAFSQNVRVNESSFLFKAKTSVVADVPTIFTARCAAPGPGLAGGQK